MGRAGGGIGRGLVGPSFETKDDETSARRRGRGRAWRGRGRGTRSHPTLEHSPHRPTRPEEKEIEHEVDDQRRPTSPHPPARQKGIQPHPPPPRTTRLSLHPGSELDRAALRSRSTTSLRPVVAGAMALDQHPASRGGTERHRALGSGGHGGWGQGGYRG